MNRYYADIIAVLGQQTRLRILNTLRDSEKCVWQITAAVNEQQSNTSRHIQILLKAGLLSTRLETPRHFYRIKHDGVNYIYDTALEMASGDVDRAAAILHAISEPTRLQIADLLRYEMNATEIIAATGRKKEAISRHLTVMIEEMAVNIRRQGRFAYYTVRHPLIHSVIDTVKLIVREENRLRVEAEGRNE